MDGLLVEFFHEGVKSEQWISDYENCIPELAKACNQLIKNEWEYVKKEAKPENGK